MAKYSMDWIHKVGDAAEAEPLWDKAGTKLVPALVPYCRDTCKQHDGKRCRIMGMRPSSICEPAVEEMARMLMSGGGNQ